SDWNAVPVKELNPLSKGGMVDPIRNAGQQIGAMLGRAGRISARVHGAIGFDLEREPGICVLERPRQAVVRVQIAQRGKDTNHLPVEAYRACESMEPLPQ